MRLKDTLQPNPTFEEKFQMPVSIVNVEDVAKSLFYAMGQYREAAPLLAAASRAKFATFHHFTNEEQGYESKASVHTNNARESLHGLKPREVIDILGTVSGTDLAWLKPLISEDPKELLARCEKGELQLSDEQKEFLKNRGFLPFEEFSRLRQLEQSKE